MGSKDKKQNSWFSGNLTCLFLLFYASSLPGCFILIVIFIICFPMATRSLCQGASPVCLPLRSVLQRQSLLQGNYRLQKSGRGDREIRCVNQRLNVLVVHAIVNASKDGCSLTGGQEQTRKVWEHYCWGTDRCGVWSRHRSRSSLG